MGRFKENDIMTIESYKAMLSKERGPAMANLYKVSIPFAAGPASAAHAKAGSSNEYLNLLCRGTALPGRSIQAIDKTMGVTQNKVATGYNVDSLTLNFQLTNSYALRKFFVEWQRKIVDTDASDDKRKTVGYYMDYVQDIEIMQMRKGESFPVISASVGNGIKLPAIVRDSLPTVGATGNFSGVDLGELSEGNLNLGVVSDKQAIYKVKLIRCYPENITLINFDDEQNRISEFSVSLAFENWIEEDFDAKRTVGDKVIDAVNDVVGSALGAVFG
jgi:hypothetical protein